MKEFVLAAVAASGAGFFTNPLEVVKTRMQLQGELKARGSYHKPYPGILTAFYSIYKVDGLLALQRGLVPALWYQFFMNGVRLGSYQTLVNAGLTKDSEGRASWPKHVVAGALSGCIGAIIGSPIYMVKTHLQARANQSIAVGHQHSHESMGQAFKQIWSKHGIAGLWRGVSGAVPRVGVGSGTQLTTFSSCKDYIESLQVLKKGSLMTSLAASMVSGVAVVCFMTPFDVVSTRLYNQPVDFQGRGTHYRGFADCFVKVFQKEGFLGFYKGWSASWLRLGPHTVLSLVFWDETRKYYTKIVNNNRIFKSGD